MSKPKINSSTVKNNDGSPVVVIDWTDGVRFIFPVSSVKKDPLGVFGDIINSVEYKRRVVVSRTSAETALAGCEVRA